MKKSRCNSTQPERYNKGLSVIVTLLSIAVLNLTFSCNYYKVEELKHENDQKLAKQIKEFNDMDKYVIVHNLNSSFELAEVIVDENNLALTGQVRKLDPLHPYEKYPEVGQSYRYKAKKTKHLNEIHLYITEDIQLSRSQQTSIPLDKINTIAVTDHDSGKTVLMSTLAGIGIGLGVIALVFIIVALTKSSCPFIYSYNGSEYTFSGELYPGNIIKNAQNIDFLKLNGIKEINGEYLIKITNELLEIQNTDLAELLVIDHPFDTEILLDPDGKPVLFYDMIMPKHLLVDGIERSTGPLLKKDYSHYSFNSYSDKGKGIRDLILTFEKPVNQQEANLYLSIKNSFWLDYIYGKFNEKFGYYYNSFQKQQQNATREETQKWIDSQNLPLKIYIKENDSWKFVDEIVTAGPMAFRDIGIKIPVNNSQSKKIEIKLETGFMFWDIDYAAIDYPERNSSISIQELKPTSAISNNSKNVRLELECADDKYITQASYGDAIEIKYRASSQKQTKARSVFLKNKGYYTYIRDYKGIPDFDELKKFREPGHFPVFSQNSFYKIIRPYIVEEDIAVTAYED